MVVRMTSSGHRGHLGVMGLIRVRVGVRLYIQVTLLTPLCKSGMPAVVSVLVRLHIALCDH